MLDEDEDVFEDIPEGDDDPEEHRLVTMDLSNKGSKENVKTPDGIELQEIGESHTEETPLKKDS